MSKHYEYKENYGEELIEFLGNGLEFRDFHGEIEVPARYVDQWLNVSEEFKDAYEIGMAKYRIFWAKIEMTKAIGKRGRGSAKD